MVKTKQGFQPQRFEVRGLELLQFSAENDAGAEPRSRLSLLGAQLQDSGDDGCTFRLKGPHCRTLVLRAASADVKRQWVAHLRYVLAMTPRPTSSTPRTSPQGRTPRGGSILTPRLTPRAEGNPQSVQALAQLRQLAESSRQDSDWGSLSDSHCSSRWDSPLASTSAGRRAVHIPKDCVVARFGSPRGYSTIYSDSEDDAGRAKVEVRLEGYAMVQRQGDIEGVKQRAQLLACCTQAFPELPAGAIRRVEAAPLLPDGTAGEKRQCVLEGDGFHPDVLAAALNDGFCLVLIPSEPLCVVDICADYDVTTFKQVELRYFVPDCPTLLQWVNRWFPLTQQFLEEVQYIDQAQTKVVRLTMDVPWDVVVGECQVLYIVTGFAAEDKEALLRDWQSSLHLAPLPAAIVPPPRSVSSAVLHDRIVGCVLGALLGNALGVATQAMPSEMARKAYGMRGLPEARDIARQLRARPSWSPGEWTDASDQLFVVLGSVCRQGGAVDLDDLAVALLHWRDRGIAELMRTKPLPEDLDAVEEEVFQHVAFLTDAHLAASCVLEGSEDAVRELAAMNGLLWRTLPLAFFYAGDALRRNTIVVARMTHAHPRCVAAAVALNHALGRLLRDHPVVMEDVLREALGFACQLLQGDADSLSGPAQCQELIELDLDDPEEARAVAKPVGCAFLSLRGEAEFEASVKKVVMEGGDAQTNAGITGALVGAAVGAARLPAGWVRHLPHRQWVADRLQPLWPLLGVANPP
eukprot:EG_transcript_3413